MGFSLGGLIGGGLGFLVGGPAGAAIGASIGGGIDAQSAAQDASGAQVDAANNASANSLTASRESNALQKQMFDKQIALQQPFREGGLTAQNRLMTLLGLGGADRQTQPQAMGGNSWTAAIANAASNSLNAGGGGEYAGGDRASADFGKYAKDFGMADFQQDPGYQWRMQQGQQALERSAAARGGLLSGRAAKDMTNYSQGAASQEYGNAFNRYQTNRSNQLNPLQSLSGMAQTASGAMGTDAGNYGSNVGNSLMNTANQVGNNMMGAGNARASGYVGSANAMNQGISGGINAFQNYNMMNKLFPSGGGQSGMYSDSTLIPMQAGGGY